MIASFNLEYYQLLGDIVSIQAENGLHLPLGAQEELINEIFKSCKTNVNETVRTCVQQ